MYLLSYNQAIGNFILISLLTLESFNVHCWAGMLMYHRIYILHTLVNMLTIQQKYQWIYLSKHNVNMKKENTDLQFYF